MKNIYDVIRQKEQEISELQRDIEALRTAARLLADEHDAPESYASRASNTANQGMPGRSPAAPMATAAAGALKEFP